jgi:hypothetical protein
MAKIKALTPKEALVQWAKQNGITPAKLSEKTGYSYMHCWSLLRGDTVITAGTLGWLTLAFGAESVAEIAEAMRAEMPFVSAAPNEKKGTGPLGGKR